MVGLVCRVVREPGWGVHADAHLDLHELGMELCSEALEETMTSEEALALFEMAASKYSTRAG